MGRRHVGFISKITPTHSQKWLVSNSKWQLHFHLPFQYFKKNKKTEKYAKVMQVLNNFLEPIMQIISMKFQNV